MNTALLLLAFAAGDPIPKESEAARIKRVWGELVDPGGGTTIKLDGDKLRMIIPAGRRLVNRSTNARTEFAPYVCKSFEGNFQFTVTVHHHSAPGNAVTNNNEHVTGSGIIALFDDKTMLTYYRATVLPQFEHQFQSEMRYPSGSMGSRGGNSSAAKPESVQMRLTRIGEKLDMEYRQDDGKKWQRFTTYKRPTNHAVKIGIFAEHACESATETAFSDLELKTIEADEKK